MALLFLHVHRDAFLAPVQHHEIGAFILLVWPEMARLVAEPRHFDLDDLSAQIGQHRGTKRPRHDPGQIQHPYSRQ